MSKLRWLIVPVTWCFLAVGYHTKGGGGGGGKHYGSDGGIEGCPLVLRRPSEEVQRRGLFVLADVVRAIFGFCGGEDGAYPVSIVVVIKWCEECVPVNRAESGLSTVELRATILG